MFMPAELTSAESRAKQALQSMAARIVEEAAHQQLPLTDIEKKMLNFSESIGDPSQIEVADQFDVQCDDAEYEGMIAGLIRQAYSTDKEQGRGNVWEDWLEGLRDQDCYLLVMVEQAGLKLSTSPQVGMRVPTSVKSWLPSNRDLYMLVAAGAICLLGLYFLLHIHGDWWRLLVFVAAPLLIWLIGKIYK